MTITLKEWKTDDEAGVDDTSAAAEVSRKERMKGAELALHNAICSLIYLKQSGPTFAQLQKDLSNSFSNGTNNIGQ